MGCLYCGKEIGALRLLRDSEFCNALHRKKYGERLGRALQGIGAPEPAPAGVAGFRVQMPVQQGNLSATLNLWQSVPGAKRIRTGAHWPLTLDNCDTTDTSDTSDTSGTSDGGSPPSAIPESAPVECPPQSERWMNAPPAEPVAAFVQPLIGAAPVHRPRAARFAAELELPLFVDRARHAPAACERWMTAPPAEPVAAFVQASAGAAPVRRPWAARFAAELEFPIFVDRARHAPTVCESRTPAPAPEPVAAFVQASAGAAPVHRPWAARFAAGLEFPLFVDGARHAPAPCENWMTAPPAEPVAAFVQPFAGAAPVRRPWAARFAAELEFPLFVDRARHAPAACENRRPAPAPEPVAAFVPASTRLFRVHTLRFPRLAAELEPTPLMVEGLFAALPPPEPVTSCVQATAAPAAVAAAHRLPLAAGGTPQLLQDSSPAACSLWMPFGAEAALSGTRAHAPRLAAIPCGGRRGAPLRPPATQVAAELEPLSVLEESFEPPAMCRRWMPVPAADPVYRFVKASAAPAVAVHVSLKAPAACLSVAAPHISDIVWNTWQRLAPRGEAVMMPVRPTPSNPPLAPIRKATLVVLPAAPQVAREPFGAAHPACTPAPEAVESWLVAAQGTVPVSIRRASRASLELAAPLAVLEPAPAIAKPVAGPAPAGVESLLSASVAAPMVLAAAVRMLPFVVAASEERTVPRFEAQRLAPRIQKPYAAAPRLPAPQPIATIAVVPPAAARLLHESVLPSPDLLPLEFHTSRMGSAPVGRAEWIWPRPALQPPHFLLQPGPEKLGEPAPRQKTARKEPEFITILKRPAAGRLPSVLMVAGRVAAAFLLAASLWYGVANLRGDHQLAAHEDVSSSDAALSAANHSDPVTLPNGGAPAPAGPVAWARRTIADRAAVKITENFRSLENWKGGAKGAPAGWSRHPDGYVNTGALALFRPTLKFSDYRMEFFGQIETKGIGWTVRAADTRNYHAMKLNVVESGMRPFVALVQYTVVNGKSGRRTQTPLNVMVHNNRPMQFTVDVRGNRFVTSIDGEEVDSFIDNTLMAGGVGFFSEAGERARLYWMRVSRNDDWLGHVCAMLADGTGAGSTAGLRRLEIPGGAPLPGMPADRDGMTQAAAWIGLPYLRGARKARLLRTWRNEPWNT